mmetsp:Transcript_17/g.26  ORF Transcript_17/g.26 Transcript_17/m.26 type:complete len:243 (+) Transcript_17:676-1404(+)
MSTIGPWGGPIVVIGSTSIVFQSSIGLEATDSHQEDSTMLFTKDVLTFLGGSSGVLFNHLFGGGENKFFGQDRVVTEFFADCFFCVDDRLVDILNCLLQVFNVTFGGIHDLFPIPLIDVKGMSEIDIIVTTKTTEISYNTLSGRDLVVVKGPPLPLGKRERNFELDIFEVARSECCRPFGSIKVVVESRPFGNEHGARHTLEVDVLLKIVLESSLERKKCFFLLQVIFEDGLVAFFENLLRG